MMSTATKKTEVVRSSSTDQCQRFQHVDTQSHKDIMCSPRQLPTVATFGDIAPIGLLSEATTTTKVVQCTCSQTLTNQTPNHILSLNLLLISSKQSLTISRVQRNLYKTTWQHCFTTFRNCHCTSAAKHRKHVRKHFFACRVVNVWNSLPLDSDNFRSLYCFRSSRSNIDFSRFLITEQYVNCALRVLCVLCLYVFMLLFHSAFSLCLLDSFKCWFSQPNYSADTKVWSCT